MVTNYQDLLKKYDAEAKTVTDAVNETRGKEVQGMQQRIVAYRDNAQKSYNKKESDITKPLYEKEHLSKKLVKQRNAIHLDAASLFISR